MKIEDIVNEILDLVLYEAFQTGKYIVTADSPVKHRVRIHESDVIPKCLWNKDLKGLDFKLFGYDPQSGWFTSKGQYLWK